MSDAEVSFLLTEEGGDPLRAAARAAETLAAKYSREFEQKRVGPLQLGSRSSSRAAALLKLSKTLWVRATRSDVGPYAGGISRSDKDSHATDTDSVRPAFRRRMQEYPTASLVGGNSQEDLLSPPQTDPLP